MRGLEHLTKGRHPNQRSKTTALASCGNTPRLHLEHQNIIKLFSKRVREVVSVRILIADDSTVMRESLRGLLRHSPDWELCCEAKDGEEAVQKAKELGPDLIILDLAMPNKDGLSAASEINEARPEVPILLYTTEASPLVESEARARGIRKIISKSDTANLISAIEEVLPSKSSPKDQPVVTSPATSANLKALSPVDAASTPKGAGPIGEALKA